MWVVAFSWFSGKEIKNGGYTDVAHCTEGLSTLVETIPGLLRAPPWLLNERLVTWKCFQYKVWQLTCEAKRKNRPFHAQLLCPVPLVALGPSLSLHPLQRWWFPRFLVGRTSPLRLAQPSKDPQRWWPACLPFQKSTLNDMGNVGFCVFPPLQTNYPGHVLFSLGRWPLSQAVKPHLIYVAVAHYSKSWFLESELNPDPNPQKHRSGHYRCSLPGEAQPTQRHRQHPF